MASKILTAAGTSPNEVELAAVPPFSIEWDDLAVEVVGRSIDGSLVRGLRDLDRRPIPLCDWRHGRTAQDALFGSLDDAWHAFSSEPQAWLKPSEPQITQGWSHFLSDARQSPDVLWKRQLSFLTALLGAADPIRLPGRHDPVVVQAEVPGRHAGQNRYIDLVLEWKIQDGENWAVAVEFKFNHHVTDRQLADYRQIMKRRIKDTERMRLVVVLADHGSYPFHRRRSKNWRVLLWRNLLRRIEKLTPDADLEFARFRHMAWQRCLT